VTPHRARHRLRPRAPFGHRALLAFLAARAIPGVEAVAGDTYARTLRLPGGPGVVALRLGPRSVVVDLALTGADDEAEALEVARRICDARADPSAVAAALGADALLAPLVAGAPGLRSPGTADGPELLVRAITGQQVSVAGARTTLGRLAAAHGDALAPAPAAAAHELLGPAAPGRLFPSPRTIATLDPAALGMPRSRGAAIVAAARACADGLRLDPSADPAATRAALLELPGVGPWTAEYVAMRALQDPDAFLASDLGIRRALERLGVPGDPRAAAARAERWRPWRAYAAHHLWHSLAARA
jgi:AraC family transcriptional regulator of adaptative response / DNA-3-methyladenine glycosylase II